MIYRNDYDTKRKKKHTGKRPCFLCLAMLLTFTICLCGCGEKEDKPTPVGDWEYRFDVRDRALHAAWDWLGEAYGSERVSMEDYFPEEISVTVTLRIAEDGSYAQQLDTASYEEAERICRQAIKSAFLDVLSYRVAAALVGTGALEYDGITLTAEEAAAVSAAVGAVAGEADSTQDDGTGAGDESLFTKALGMDADTYFSTYGPALLDSLDAMQSLFNTEGTWTEEELERLPVTRNSLMVEEGSVFSSEMADGAVLVFSTMQSDEEVTK